MVSFQSNTLRVPTWMLILFFSKWTEECEEFLMYPHSHLINIAGLWQDRVWVDVGAQSQDCTCTHCHKNVYRINTSYHSVTTVRSRTELLQISLLSRCDLRNSFRIIWSTHVILMTALFLPGCVHNGPLSRDAVRAELDFVHCGSDPLSGMEKISLILGLHVCMFVFLMLLIFCRATFSDLVHTARLSCS